MENSHPKYPEDDVHLFDCSHIMILREGSLVVQVFDLLLPVLLLTSCGHSFAGHLPVFLVSTLYCPCYIKIERLIYRRHVHIRIQLVGTLLAPKNKLTRSSHYNNNVYAFSYDCQYQ